MSRRSGGGHWGPASDGARGFGGTKSPGLKMSHPTEDELIQHLCSENDARDRARVADHLETCAECQLACEEITGALTMVNDAVPEPPDGFERIMWAKVRQVIEHEPVPSRWTWRSLIPAGAIAAITVVGISVVNRPSEMTPATTPNLELANVVKDDNVQNRVLYTALDNHFRQTEMLLVEVRNASDRDSLDFERMTAEDLLSAGRLYRMTAEDGGHPRLVRMLDELEPVLVEVARNPNRSSNDRAWLRSKIEDDSLLFKVRAATTDIRERVAIANADQ